MLKFLLKSAIYAAANSYDTPARKGARGERQVHGSLSSVLDKNDYRVLSDLIVPTRNATTQIDHVVLSRFGVFVIETKNMSGWIFGGHDQARWTQVLKGGKKRRFQNPIRQNFGHAKAVQSVLGVDEATVFNFVVFVGSAEPKTAMPEEIAWGLRDLGRLIGCRRQNLFSGDQIQGFVNTLNGAALENSRSVRNDHLRNIERLKSAPTTVAKNAMSEVAPHCPSCNGAMVKRKNRKTGESFLGCSRFPKCRGTRQIR